MKYSRYWKNPLKTGKATGGNKEQPWSNEPNDWWDGINIQVHAVCVCIANAQDHKHIIEDADVIAIVIANINCIHLIGQLNNDYTTTENKFHTIQLYM